MFELLRMADGDHYQIMVLLASSNLESGVQETEIYRHTSGREVEAGKGSPDETRAHK